MRNKTYYVNEDYPSESWENILGLTAEAAESILTPDEFAEWRQDRDAKEREYQARLDAHRGYYPGCYGDPLTDC